MDSIQIPRQQGLSICPIQISRQQGLSMGSIQIPEKQGLSMDSIQIPEHQNIRAYLWVHSKSHKIRAYPWVQSKSQTAGLFNYRLLSSGGLLLSWEAAVFGSQYFPLQQWAPNQLIWHVFFSIDLSLKQVENPGLLTVRCHLSHAEGLDVTFIFTSCKIIRSIYIM